MRCGWTLPRQVGPAVVRNRLKRWSRVYFRNVIATESQLPVDINLVFRKSDDDFFKKLDYESFASVVDKSWRQIRQSIGQKTGRKTVQSVGKKTGQKAGPKVKEPASNQGEDK